MVAALVLDRALEDRLRRSPRRAAFYCRAVASLARELRERGTQLVVRRGPRRATVVRLAREAGARTVVWSASYEALGKGADRDLQAALEEAGMRALVVHDAPSISPDETSALHSEGGSGYRALAPFVAAWTGLAPAELDPRELTFAAHALHSETLPNGGDFDAPGAEFSDLDVQAEAASALKTFLAGPVLGYRAERGAAAAETSRLSAHLAFGTIGAGTVARRLATRAADPFLLVEERTSLDAFRRALATRDFFLQLALHFDERLDRVLQPKMRDFPFASHHPALEAWREGRTGYPLVDAGVRQLRRTGWMHPSVRPIVASFLCFDLGVDWRAGRDEWEGHLVEDDLAVANGNWQWIAGVGADQAAYPRIYHPLKAARRLDPAATFIRRWVPELTSLPAASILNPAERSGGQLALPLFGASGYPAPVLDHEVAARAFLKRYAAHARSQSARSLGG